jgi:hypothetical protein
MILSNKSKKSQILSSMTEAKSFWPRLKGLLGQSSLGKSSGLWIRRCNSIHTFGMKFPIDCIFLDSELKVRRVVENVVPGKLVWPVWGSTSVVEVSAGTCRNMNIEIGDTLDVGN